jgi:hypothetical protein
LNLRSHICHFGKIVEITKGSTFSNYSDIPFFSNALVRSQVRSCAICCGKSDTGTDCFTSTSVSIANSHSAECSALSITIAILCWSPGGLRTKCTQVSTHLKKFKLKKIRILPFKRDRVGNCSWKSHVTNDRASDEPDVIRVECVKIDLKLCEKQQYVLFHKKMVNIKLHLSLTIVTV